FCYPTLTFCTGESTMAPVDKMLGDYTRFFAIFGAVSASYVALKVVSAILSVFKNHVLAGPLGLSTNLKKFGSWAVVTGATDGIGKAYAQQLAKLGFNIVLISRNPDKLADVALEIESKEKVKTKSIPVDFTGGVEIYDKIGQDLSNMDIGVLVNNVGMAYEHPEFFLEIEGGNKKLIDLINCNIYSVTLMTKAIMPGMVERRKGAIINISSASAVHPNPLMTVYSATKAYMDFFSRALQAEYKSKGIIVQSVLPSFVATKLSKIRRPTFFAPDPTTYVKGALSTVGVESRTFGCLSHAMQWSIVSTLPEWLINMVAVPMHIGIRKKALKKKAAKQE
ncbi:unnamed protein product, partial [Owenia fusiformis]